MRLGLAYEMQRPMVDDHAVVEETIEQCVLADRMLVAGDPESCLRSIAIHEAAGVDALQFLMATETVPHERVMSSIELFGTHVIPELRKKAASPTLVRG